MAFPQSVLPVRVKIAPGAEPAGDQADWVWEDVTSDVRTDPGIVIEAGRQDEANRVDPSKCSLTFDNRSGNYSTRNVLGKWYGKIGLNTPLRVSTVAVQDTFSRTVSGGLGTANTGQTWTMGSPSDWSVDGSVGKVSYAAANVVRAAYTTGHRIPDPDMQVTFSVPAVLTGASFVAALMARFIDTSTFYTLSCEFNAGATITAKIRRNTSSGAVVLASAVDIAGLSYTPGQKIRMRAQLDGAALRVKIWPDGTAQPAAWACTVTDTDPLAITDAGDTGIYTWLVAGNTNTKPFVASFDDLEVEAIEYGGLVPEWTPRWDKSAKDATTPVAAAGILRRLQQGKSPLKSPMTRAFLRYQPVGYWPGEDDSGATAMGSAVARGRAASARAAQFGEDATTLAGAKSVIGITASTVLSGRIPTHSSTGTWGVVFCAYLLAPPAASTRILTVTSNGTVRTWAVDLDTSGVTLRGYDVDGVQIVTAAQGYPGLTAPPGWVAYSFNVMKIGGNIQATLIQYAVGDPGAVTFWVAQQTIAGVPGAPATWRVEGSLGFNEGRFSQLSVFNYEPPFVTYAFIDAVHGYLGESATDRIKRLCAEENVPVIVEDGESEPQGPQRVDTFLNLLYAVEDSDLGILYERSFGLAYRPRGARYNRPVEMALDFDAGHIAEPPEPSDDDQQVKNQWTVTRDGGSSAVADDPDSIARVGLLDDSKTINVASDDVLDDHAWWRLRLSSADAYRWPRIELNFARNPSQIALWRSLREFFRLTIANEPSQVTGNAIDLIAEGYTMTLGPYGWDAALNCSPAGPWLVPVVDDPASRIDTDGSRLNGARSATATSLSVEVYDGPLWTTDPADFPLDVNIAGIRITVTSITGTSSPQTFAVLRSVDGFDKPLPDDSDVRLWSPSYMSL